MSFDSTSSDLQLIWDSFIDFESFSREAGGDLDHFIEKWKKKMGKVMSAGIQLPDLLLGLKLIEKSNLNQEYIESVISKLGSSNYNSGSFLGQVITVIKESRDNNELIVDKGKYTDKDLRHKELDQEELSATLESSSNLVSCSKCSVHFFSAESLSKHFLESHSEAIKDEVYNSEMKHKPAPGLLKCPYCDKKFMLLETFEVHLKSHAKSIISKSEGVVYVRGDSSESNTENPKDDIAFDDEIKIEIMSDFGFQTDTKNCQVENTLDTNFNTLPYEAFKCNICSKEFTKSMDFKYHMITHKTTIDHICPYCDKSHKTRFGLYRDLQRKHKANMIISEEDLEGFKSTHMVKCSPCEICNRVVSNANMANHVKTHTRVSSKCSICHKEFSQSGLLRRHMETHKTTRVKCPWCNKTVKTKYQMYTHMKRIHGRNYSSTEGIVEIEKGAHTKMNSSSRTEVSVCNLSNIITTKAVILTPRTERCPSQVATNAEDQSDGRGSTCDGRKKISDSTEKEELNMEENYVELENSSNVVSCPKCTGKFLDHESLSKHYDAFHAEIKEVDDSIHSGKESKTDQVLLKCPYCDKNFTLLETLETHLKSHDNVFIFKSETAVQECSGSPETNTTSPKEDSFLNDGTEKEILNDTSLKSDMENVHVQDSQDINLITKPCEPFKCNICQKEFTKSIDIKCHMDTHKITTEYLCPHCDKGHKTRFGLNRHLQRKHKTKIINLHLEEGDEVAKPIRAVKSSPCEICHRVVSNANMANHVKTHNRDPFKCSICEKVFQQAQYLRHHMETHKTTRVNCPQCDNTFKTKDSLYHHIRKMHKKKCIKNHMKELGDKTDNSTSGNTENKEKENNVRKSLCEICSRLITNTSMAKHMETHTRGPFKCSTCQKEFSKSFLLKKHMETHNTTRDHKCIHCDKAFKTKSTLYSHTYQHSNGCSISKKYVQYPCEICGKFVDNARLGAHMKTHGHKAYECNICQKQFKTKGHLQQHLPTHNATNEYICSYCGKKYKTKMSLNEHMNLHTKGKPLPCKFCNKIFFSHGLRTFHIRAHHTGEKPYKCDFCDKRFYISSRKTQHMRYHTGEKPYQCHICGKYFKEGTTRKRHIRNVHKEVQPDDV